MGREVSTEVGKNEKLRTWN